MISPCDDAAPGGEMACRSIGDPLDDRDLVAARRLAQQHELVGGGIVSDPPCSLLRLPLQATLFNRRCVAVDVETTYVLVVWKVARPRGAEPGVRRELHQHDRHLLESDREGWNQEVSPTYRSHRRPGTGAASTKCHPPTGATMSIMNRDSTTPLLPGVKSRYPDDPLAPAPRRH